MNRYLIFFCLSLLSPFMYAQDAAKQEYSANRLLLNDVSYTIIPILSFAPETNLGLGGGGQFLFRTRGSDSTSRFSNALLLAMVTTKKQLIIEFLPQVYLRNESYYIESHFRYKKFPNSFWGIGNDTSDDKREEYDMRSIHFRFSLIKKLPPYFGFGLQYNLDDNKMLEVTEGGLLQSGSVPGYNYSFLSGMGVIFRLDTRDNYFAPTKGYFSEFQTNFTSKAMGSTHSYAEYILDFRKFTTFIKNQVLAIQFYAKLTYDDVSFQALSKLGGPQKNRGYFEGRFTDKDMISAQAEYRIKLKPRWSVNAFISAGEVASEVTGFGKDLKLSSGGGLRFRIKKDNPTSLRFDVGIGEHGNKGFYFGVNEVF